MSLFPTLMFLIILTHIVALFLVPQIWLLLSFIFFIYLFPLITYRIHNFFAPLKEQMTDITQPKYNSWWGGHQIQLIYIAMPFLESPLHLVPGLFSFWLRLWGSKIGKGVYWTPRVEVVDRGLLEIGDGVVIGHLVAFCSHAVSPYKGKMALVVKKIRLGDNVFVGAESRLAPGVVVPDKKLIKARSLLYWRGEYKA